MPELELDFGRGRGRAEAERLTVGVCERNTLAGGDPGVDIEGGLRLPGHLTVREWQALRKAIKDGALDGLYPGDPGGPEATP